MKTKTMIFWGTLALCGAAQLPSTAIAQTGRHACTDQAKTDSCDRSSFENAVGAAKTIAIQVPRMDAHSSKQLQKLVAYLGKTVQPDGGDLTLVLTRPEVSGIDFGPSSRPLAVIHVYSRASATDQGELIWTEIYSGQPDTPWPTAVHRVIEQLRADMKQP
ncbi:hypothetical protein [Silvibacterium sp.]|uniref:hypothetical protein n=1 Tax=Silvibacterium sp. TaxID=1964179 RepID=UPI0039E5324E